MTMTEAEESDATGASESPNRDDYVVPIVHTHVPRRMVDVGFWGALGASVALGVVDPPLGILLGVGVVVARHRNGAHAAESG